MTSKAWIVFPNQLFSLSSYTEANLKVGDFTFHLVEEPLYFGSERRVARFNKVKLLFQRAAMQYYLDYLHSNKVGLGEVQYHDYETLIGNEDRYGFLERGGSVSSSPVSELHIWDPVDRLLLPKMQAIADAIGTRLQVHETPNFLLNGQDIDDYLRETGAGTSGKRFNHATFYEWTKKRLGILTDERSYDEMNRQKFPAGITFPPLPPNDTHSTPYVKDAAKYVESVWPDAYGSSDPDGLPFPVTHQTSETWFRDFLEKRFKNFGPYQDGISQKEDFGFHSLIAPMLNAGLLDPAWILEETEAAFKAGKAPMQSYEGFVRQLIGWREYSRMLYEEAYEPMKEGNHFGNDRALTRKWYDGSLGVLPVDDTIQAAFGNGYLHHILRLMMMSNFMNLVGLHPHEVYRWFMEFSCDSYDWVMINNVYSMGLWADGGLTMRKPYITSSNYILKMSDFKKDKQWEELWTDLFYHFLVTRETELAGTPYVRNLSHYRRKSPAEQDALLQRARKFIESVTTKY